MHEVKMKTKKRTSATDERLSSNKVLGPNYCLTEITETKVLHSVRKVSHNHQNHNLAVCIKTQANTLK